MQHTQSPACSTISIKSCTEKRLKTWTKRDRNLPTRRLTVEWKHKICMHLSQIVIIFKIINSSHTSAYLKCSANGLDSVSACILVCPRANLRYTCSFYILYLMWKSNNFEKGQFSDWHLCYKSNLKSTWDRLEIDLRSTWDQLEIDLRSTWDRPEIDLRSTWDRLKIDLRST